MRTTPYIATALVLIALAPLATPAVPPTCGNPCTIEARSTGYLPPLVSIASGTNVSWVNKDGSHVQADANPNVGALECFSVATGTVTFTIDGGDLKATQGNVTTTCDNAEEVTTGVFALPYYCKLHPWMRAAIVVS